MICRNGNVTFFRRCSHSKKRDIWVIFSDMKKRSDQCLKLAHQTVREPAQLFISHWGKPHFLSINWIWNKMWFFAIFEVRIRIFFKLEFLDKNGIFAPLCLLGWAIFSKKRWYFWNLKFFFDVMKKYINQGYFSTASSSWSKREQWQIECVLKAFCVPNESWPNVESPPYLVKPAKNWFLDCCWDTAPYCVRKNDLKIRTIVQAVAEIIEIIAPIVSLITIIKDRMRWSGFEADCFLPCVRWSSLVP